MKSSLLQLITRNWPIKGAALFLALMLYVAVQLQQPVTTSFDVTLNIQLPRGRTLLHPPPKVRVQISGKGSQILKLRSLAGDITRRVPDTLTTPTWSIHLDPSDVELALPKGADVRVMEVRPSEITIALDSVARKQVIVTGDMGRIAERSFAGIPVESGGGAITSFIVTPSRVLVSIRGPEERVQALTRDSLRVVAHITGTGGGVARITVIAPRGIIARAIPDSVTLRRRATPPAPRRRG